MAEEIDRSGTIAQDTNEALNFLQNLADKQLELFKRTITDELKSADQSKTLPITAIIKRDGQTRSFLAKESDNIDKIIDTIADVFIGKKDATTGITSVLKTLVKVFLGTSQGEEQHRETYFAYTDGISLFRLDFMAWKRNVKAESLRTHTESVSAFYYTISVIDVHKVDFQTFVALYQEVLDKSDLTPDEIIAAIRKLKEIYDELKEQSRPALQQHYARNYGPHLLQLD